MTAPLPPAIFLMGPTASGKTDLAIELARLLPIGLISVDSALIYRGMDIGTAKPAADILAAYPHRLIDIRDPAESYSAADFRVNALAAMAEITAAGRIPLLVGGTMLYFKALLDGLADMPSADPAIRAEIEAQAQTHGWANVHHQLAVVDPVSAARIHPNDPQRVLRALEVFRVSGRTMTEHRASQHQVATDLDGASQTQLPYTVAQLILAPSRRDVLHARIAERFAMMLEQGFIDEVSALRARPDLHPGLPAMRAVGYRQVWEYLEGAYTREEMVAKSIAATRQLAKRQFTWLRGWHSGQWFDSLACDNLPRILKSLANGSISPRS